MEGGGRGRRGNRERVESTAAAPGDGHPRHDDGSSLLVEAGCYVVEVGGGICPAGVLGETIEQVLNFPLTLTFSPLLPQCNHMYMYPSVPYTHTVWGTPLYELRQAKVQ